jgi:hypothetical protein
LQQNDALALRQRIVAVIETVLRNATYKLVLHGDQEDLHR